MKKERESKPDKGFSELTKKYPFLKNGYLEFSFILSICLHLQEDTCFEVYVPNRKYPFIIKTKEIIEESSEHGTGKGIEVVSDLRGGFRLTFISIIFPDKNPEIPKEKLREVYEKDIIRAANLFLDAYRHVTGRYPIQSIIDLESVRNLQISRCDKSGKCDFLLTISFGKGATIAPYQPLRTKEEHKKLRELAERFSIPLEDLFLMDVKRHYFMGRDLEALVIAVTALEIVVNKKEVHIRYSLKERLLRVFFKNLYRGLLKRKVKKLLLTNSDIPKSLLGDVKFAIRERDAVVHRGRKILKGNIRKHVYSIEQAINYIKKLP